MSKDTRIWSALPARLSLAVAAAMLTPAMVQADPEDSQEQEQSSYEQQQQSSYEQSSQETSQQGSDDLNQLAEQESDLSEFVKAVEKSGMTEALTSGTNYTIFAPTNDAFESDSNLKELMESDDPQDRQELVDLLRAHIVADDVDAEMARTIGKAQTVGGGTVDLTSDGDKLKVGDAEVVTADIQQGSLRIHTIDGVLEPSATSSMASSSESSSESGTMTSVDFDELDQDGDGYLSEEELQAQEELAAEQDQLDSNQDGQISRTEFAAFEQGSDMPSSTDPQSSSDRSGSDIPPHNEGEPEWESEDERDWQTDDR
jgi:uncharacterized surface protein with fasciclin (FAS1) repeats